MEGRLLTLQHLVTACGNIKAAIEQSLSAAKKYTDESLSSYNMTVTDDSQGNVTITFSKSAGD